MAQNWKKLLKIDIFFGIIIVGIFIRRNRMNQILVTEKLYITPELRRKKKMYKIQFFLSVFLVCLLFSYYIYLIPIHMIIQSNAL